MHHEQPQPISPAATRNPGYPFHCPKRPKAVPLPHPSWCWRPLTPSSSGAVLLWAVKWITRLRNMLFKARKDSDTEYTDWLYGNGS